MEVALTRMSSKGQVVIPAALRKGIAEGDKLIVFRSRNHIIMKQTSSLEKNFKEDLAFARRTEAAWKRIKEGKGVEMDFDAFIDEMRTW